MSKDNEKQRALYMGDTNHLTALKNAKKIDNKMSFSRYINLLVEWVDMQPNFHIKLKDKK